MPNSENQESMLSINKASEILGVSHKILRDKIAAGEIKTVNWGSEVRIPRWYLIKWQQEQLELSGKVPA